MSTVFFSQFFKYDAVFQDQQKITQLISEDDIIDMTQVYEHEFTVLYCV